MASVQIDHVLTFWTSAAFTYLDKFVGYLKAAGFGDCVPEPRTPLAALKSALEEQFPSRDWRVEILKGRTAYEIIRIERGEDRNEYRHCYKVEINEQGGVLLNPFDMKMATEIVATFNTHLGLVTPASVTRSLIAILAGLHGNRLREDGGLYGLPQAGMERWLLAAQAAELSSARGKCKVYLVPHHIDEHSVRAIRDAIVREVEGEAHRMLDEVRDGELGARALQHRSEHCALLREKIKVYEELLNEGLTGLSAAVNKADEAAMGAQLLLSTAAN